MVKPINLEREILYDLYINKRLTIDEVCKVTGVKSRKTLIKYMKQHDIKARDVNKESSLLTRLGVTDDQFKEILLTKYKGHSESMNEIAREFNVSHVIIKKYLNKFGIPTRSKKEANTLQHGGTGNRNWRGGKITHNEGYKMIYMPSHPHHAYANYVYEHRLVMEQHIGRLLNSDEHIHHINGIRDDNRIENLQTLTNSEHRHLHNEQKRKDKNKDQMEMDI